MLRVGGGLIGTTWLSGSCRTRGTRFVDGMVELEVLTLQIGAALPVVVEPDEGDTDVVLRAFADQEGIARAMPQASSIRAEVAGQWLSSSMASCSDDRIRSYTS